MELDQGDLVLVPVPFTNLTSQKRRPVIVISNSTYNRRSAEVVVVAMTSNPQWVLHSFTITDADIVAGSLNRPGTVRADKIYALAQSIIVKKFAQVSPSVIERIRGEFAALTKPAS